MTANTKISIPGLIAYQHARECLFIYNDQRYLQEQDRNIFTILSEDRDTKQHEILRDFNPECPKQHQMIRALAAFAWQHQPRSIQRQASRCLLILTPNFELERLKFRVEGFKQPFYYKDHTEVINPLTLIAAEDWRVVNPKNSIVKLFGQWLKQCG
jgi:hypothetical protein